MRWNLTIAGLCVAVAAPVGADAACSFFAALDRDINQPSQVAFITWDAAKQLESFTVQPRFEGNAVDFGMVIPTPTQPKLKEAPKEIFKDLALFTVLKPSPCRRRYAPRSSASGGMRVKTKARKLRVKVLEAGKVGTLDYKIIKAENASDLFEWLKQHKYSFSGDKATLDFYVKKRWLFTVMKVDPSKMKKRKDGSYLGEITPTRFRFKSPELIYPLRITSISVKSTTEALLYVMTDRKIHIPRSKLEFAKELTAADIKRLSSGKVAIPQSRFASHAVQRRDFKGLKGWLKKGRYLTKVRRRFAKAEMTDDLRINYAGNEREHTTYQDCGGAPP